MRKNNFRRILLLFTLFFFLWPWSTQTAQARSMAPRKNPETTSDMAANLSFCPAVKVSKVGAICESPYGFTGRLDFPAVDVDKVLSGTEVFPHAEARFSARNQMIDGVHYRNILFILKWESTTPDFLQSYMTDILPGWEGNGVPYRLLWRASYETCKAEGCPVWTQVTDRGEYLPADIPDLPTELAADSNYNGVPASFWNTHMMAH